MAVKILHSDDTIGRQGLELFNRMAERRKIFVHSFWHATDSKLKPNPPLQSMWSFPRSWPSFELLTKLSTLRLQTYWWS